MINALFKDSIVDATEATWIGKLAVILQGKNKTDSVLFDSVREEVTVAGYGSMKASMIERITFTDNSVKFSQQVGSHSEEYHIIHVMYDEPQASFDVAFFTDHLNVNWNLQVKDLLKSHGLIGSYMNY